MSENTTQTTQSILTQPSTGHPTLLTSFRRNGEGVSTPVGTVASQGKLYFMTPTKTWKVKRIANNPRVTLAPCTSRGKPLGPAIEGSARRLSGDEAKRARALLRVGITGRIWGIIFDIRNPGDKTAVYEIALAAESVDHEMTKSALS